MAKYKSRITGRVEEWWKGVCIKHNCKYYIHEDYPKCSYCTCPNNCILLNKSKAESEDESGLKDRRAMHAEYDQRSNDS